MKVAIVKYNAGNVCSVVNAIRRLGIEPVVTDNAEELNSADRVLFPGQGEAKSTMEHLRYHHLDRLICDLKQPVLGICIGQQLMCCHSEEGDVDCLAIFDTEVKRFTPFRHEDKVPHMGWNTIHDMQCPLFSGIGNDAFVYFIHSYYVPVNPFTAAVTDYITPFSAAMHRDNFYATQFHPEKSGGIGERILQNFIDLNV